MVKTIIIDDESHARNALQKMLEENYDDKIIVIGQADGVQTGFDLIIKHDPDLIFLDVEMQDGTGFDLLERIPYNKYKIIFTTGHGHYAAKAFRYSAIDYLLKPIDINELNLALNKVSSVTFLSEMNKKIETLISNKNNFEKIAVPCNEGVELISIKNIIRCESESNYTKFFMRDSRSIFATKILKDFEDILENHGFFRCHKSHMVNLNFVKKFIDGDGGFIQMEDETQIPVARRKKKELLDLLLR